MAEGESGSLVPFPADQVSFLIATAARAPSVQNTQPWRFHVRQHSIELHADLSRRLRADTADREILISCGAALFGLWLGVRSLGLSPMVDLLPDPDRPVFLARVSVAEAGPPATAEERLMLEALPRRHTHRAPFDREPLPEGLLAEMARDAVAEGAALALVDRARGYEQLADIVAAIGSERDADPQAQADMRDWTNDLGAHTRDGVPAAAFTTGPELGRSRLRQRDFDLGRGLGMLDAGGPPPAATAILSTPGDERGDWLCAGQALHRLLARAATRWVFASLYSQPLQAPGDRSLIADRLGLAGTPQMILQLGPAHSARVTARRLPADLIDL